MQSAQAIALDFYDAVISDNGVEVQKILNNGFDIPVRTITGMLVIAVEHRLLESIRAILVYNSYTSNKIIDKHLDVILCYAAKSNLLKELGVTYH